MSSGGNATVLSVEDEVSQLRIQGNTLFLKTFPAAHCWTPVGICECPVSLVYHIVAQGENDIFFFQVQFGSQSQDTTLASEGGRVSVAASLGKLLQT